MFFAAATILALYTEFVLAMLTFDFSDALEYLDFVRALAFLTESSDQTRGRLSPSVAEKNFASSRLSIASYHPPEAEPCRSIRANFRSHQGPSVSHDSCAS